MGLRSIFLWRLDEAGERRVGSLQLKPEQGRCCRKGPLLKTALQGPSYFSSFSSHAEVRTVCREEAGMVRKAVGFQTGEMHRQDWERFPAPAVLHFPFPAAPQLCLTATRTWESRSFQQNGLENNSL